MEQKGFWSTGLFCSLPDTSNQLAFVWKVTSSNSTSIAQTSPLSLPNQLALKPTCSVKTASTLAEQTIPVELHRACLGPAMAGGLLLLTCLGGTDIPLSLLRGLKCVCYSH